MSGVVKEVSEGNLTRPTPPLQVPSQPWPNHSSSPARTRWVGQVRDPVDGMEVKHSMLAGGNPVRGAGMGQSPYGGSIKLNNHSGHYWKDNDAWRRVGVMFGDLGMVR